MLPHLKYCILAWGLNVTEGHKIHLFQKKALRFIANDDYLAHTEPICKKLQLVKMTDMYRIAIWKFYFKLMNNMLPSYFDSMKPVLPVICSLYEVRKPTFHLPHINHEYAEQLLKYQLVKILNAYGAITLTAKIHTHSFHGFKLYIKYHVLGSYVAHFDQFNHQM